MATLTATIEQLPCAGQAGQLRLSQAAPATGTGAGLTYTWLITDAAGNDYGQDFAQADLPLTVGNLPNGRYSSAVTATDGTTTYASRQYDFQVDCGPALSLDYTATTPATATGGGTVTVRGSGGASPLRATLGSPLNFQQQLAPNQQSQLETTFQNVPAGTYPGTLADAGTGGVSFSVTVGPYVVPPVLGCTDPAADNYDPQATQDDGSCTYTPVPRVAYFEVPPMQSLRFVKPGATDRPAFDNTLLADERPLDYDNPGYCQLVETGDTLAVQVLSNYTNAPVLRLRLAGGSTVARTATATRVQRGQGVTVGMEVYLRPDATAGRVRIYFNEDALPIPFFPGGRVTVGGTGTSLDGTYPVQQVLEDPAAAVPYLLVLANYPAGPVRVDGTLTTTYKTQVYDTWQLVLPFAGLDRGCYVASITAADPDFADALAVSEPVDVALAHPGTVALHYRNFDNAFGLNYSYGLVNRLRVTGRFFRRRPATEKTVLRNNDDELELLKASVYRKIDLEVLLLPDWLHEVLACAFCHDFVRVNQVQVTAEGEYTPDPVERYTLGKGTVLLEAKPFLGSGNRDDLGDPDTDGPFLVANDTFLLARKQ